MYWTRTRSFSPRAAMGDQLGLFHRIMNAGSELAVSFPAFNVWSNDDGAVVTSELPGVRMEDLDITVTGKEVSIKGERKDSEDKDVRYLRRERPSGQFTRAFELPFQIEAAKVQAKLTNGVLQIDLPRAENDKPRKIAVSAGA